MKKLTQQEIEEQELADKIDAIFKEKFALDLNRGNGVTLEKDQYIGSRTRELDEELSKLKTPKSEAK